MLWDVLVMIVTIQSNQPWVNTLTGSNWDHCGGILTVQFGLTWLIVM